MFRRLGIFIEFVGTCIRYALHVREVISALLLLLVLGGIIFSMLEGTSLGDGLYFSFVTGLTIGYGDILPMTPGGKMLSLALGALGTLLFGIVVAICTRALADTSKRHLNPTR